MAESINITAENVKSSYGTGATFTISEVEFWYSGVMYNGKGAVENAAAKQFLQLRKSGSGAGEIKNNTELALKSITIATLNDKAFTLSAGTAKDALSPVAKPTGTSGQYSFINKSNGDATCDVTIYTFDVEGMNYFDITNGSNASYFAYITIELANDDAAVKKPVISGESNFYDETAVSITCATDDAVIYYTTDENFQTSPSDVDWVPYTTALTINATTTVWAAALKGSEWSEVAEKTFTKNPSFESFDALVAAELADHTLVEVAFENVEIDSIYSNKSGKRQGIYFTVGETAYEIYFNQNEVPAAWVAGGKVSGTLRGEWTVYNDIWELKPETGFVWAEDLTYVAPSATAISNTAVEAKAVKSLENGILVIKKAGKKYNVMGQIIK